MSRKVKAEMKDKKIMNRKTGGKRINKWTGMLSLSVKTSQCIFIFFHPLLGDSFIT